MDEHPEAILDTLRAALQQLPQGHAQIRLHPEDLALVREHMGEQISHGGHRLQEDFALQRGDCRIDTQGAQLDATLETRWRRVLESLGREHAQFAPQDAVAPDGIDDDDAWEDERTAGGDGASA
ncbi:FliH/SctL family protein [Thauera humireducens]|uniref:FliH/SctL family protein n=1 Tax=Thauera humireducens TaxID=1134435 RepID=UPI00311FC0D7